MATKKTSKQVGLQYGFRSGLEESIAKKLTSQGVGFTFESMVLEYVKPTRVHKYTPDFILSNGITVESKGRFVTADRQKVLLVLKAHPELDFRMVFSNSKSRITKLSSTTYGDWCNKHSIPYADREIPLAWTKEPKKQIAS